LAFRAGLINRFGKIPTANQLALEFNFRNIHSNPISRESVRKWINGQSMPEPSRLKIIISWLNLSSNFIFSLNIPDLELPSLQSPKIDPIKQLASYELQRIEKLGQAALNFISPLTAILDSKGTIVLVNNAWRAKAMLHPKLKQGTLGCEGINYLKLCDNAKGATSEGARNIANHIREVMNDNTKHFSEKYTCHIKEEKKWFEIQISAYKKMAHVCYIVTHRPLTEIEFNKMK